MSLAPPIYPRVACVRVPNFQVEVCLHENRRLDNHPLAVAESNLDSAEILAVNTKAADSGLFAGLTVAQGHTVSPRLKIQVRNVDTEIEQSNDLYKKLQGLSPFVEEAETGLFYLDAAGLGFLYKDDRTFAGEIVSTLKPSGYPIMLGIAGNKFVARVAAEVITDDCFSIVSYNQEADFLKPLPIKHLRLSQEIMSRMDDLGLKTIGQLASIPANEMTRRFGSQGAALAKLARGDDTAFFDPNEPTESVSDTVWLTPPIYQQTIVIAQVEQMLAPLLEQLSRFSQGCSTIDVTLFLDDKNLHTIPVSVEQPTLSVTVFTRQLQLLMERLKLSAPIEGIRVTIPQIAALRAEQLPLNDGIPAGVAPLNDLPDNHTITVPVAHDTFLPEQRFTFSTPLKKYKALTQDKTPMNRRCVYALGTIGGLRLFQPPRAIEVTEDHRKPITVGYINRLEVAGPWELSGGWWSERFDRLYWEVQSANCRKYLIFLDRLTSQWFVQGVFD